MSDIFREVDEEVRRDQLTELWRRHGGKLVAVLVLSVVAVGGWRLYDTYAFRQRAAVGEAFEAAVALANTEKSAEAVEALTPIAGTGPAGYRVLARFMAASEIARTDPAGAVAAYDALALDAGVDQPLRQLAMVRAGALLVDSAAFGEVERRLGPLAAPSQTFRHYAREMLALSAYRSGDALAVTRLLDQIIADAETPPGVRQRAEFLIGLVRAGALPAR